MELSAFDERRIAVCLGGLAEFSQDPDADDNDHGTVICGASETRAHIFRRYADRYHRSEFRGARYKYYVREAQMLVRMVQSDATFAVFPGDSRTRFPIPTLVKSRMIHDRDSPCVLLPLDRRRHWGDVRAVAQNDIPFRDKADRLVWRGVTTGQFKPRDARSAYSSRFHVATLRTSRTDIDIGYSGIMQVDDTNSDIPLDALRARLRPPLDLRQQLQSRYLLSLEGNDVATGLKWMLFSNSAVLMPRPTCESWACEGELVAFEHYVPVKDDLSDIEEVFDWCLTHPDSCEEIAHNGKRYIEAFLDTARETEILRRIISAYLSKAPYRLRFGPMERLLQALPRRSGMAVSI
ncbi:MAG: hypothetical protein INF52_07945 [Rhodobacter sp.]|nr:hypothetical protein [Rhodobacter sp.]